MTRIVKLGNLKIGSGYPIRIKGMIKTPSTRIEEVISEAKGLVKEGAEAIRIAVKEEKDARIAPILKKHISLPLVADVHFHYRFALVSMEAGFDGIRLNPLNIYKEKEVKEVAREAKKYKIPIRVGINSGGFKSKFASPKELGQQMVKKVGDYLKLLEKEGFFDIMVSLKGSDILTTVVANEIYSKRFSYPLHLGVTATGPFLEGAIKSSMGLGVLILKGIGNTIRVSLTAPSFWEIRVAKHILQSLGARKFEPEIISCPTCSRCEINLIKIVDKFKRELEKVNFHKPLRIALMGCVVNGPGEAYQADIGVAFGKKKAAIFRKDRILGWSDEKNIVNDLFKEVRRIWM